MANQTIIRLLEKINDKIVELLPFDVENMLALMLAEKEN